MAKARSGLAWVLRSCFPAQSALEVYWRPDKSLRSLDPTRLQPSPVRLPSGSPHLSSQRARGASHGGSGVPFRGSEAPALAPCQVPKSPLPTFLVALGFGHRGAATCGGRRCCLLGPRRRGDLWDGPRGLSSRVPDPICAAALFSPPRHLPQSPWRL